MNFLIINGHKYYPFSQGRLNRTLFEKIVEIISQDNDVQTTIVENGYNVDEEIEKFMRANKIIFQTPVNWFSFPGILKSYFDEVYRYGDFYGPSEVYGNGGRLTDKKYMYSLTCNSPYDSFFQYGKFYDGRSVDDVFIAMHKLQQYSGLQKIKTFVCFDVIKNPNVPLFLSNLEEHLRKYVLQ